MAPLEEAAEQESDARASDVATRFRQAFSEALTVSPEGEWVGPIESPYGLHIVRVDRREGGGVPPLTEVRDAVVRDWKAARADNAEAEFFTALVERYTIVVEPEESSTRAQGEPEASPGARAVGVGPHGTDPKGGSR